MMRAWQVGPGWACVRAGELGSLAVGDARGGERCQPTRARFLREGRGRTRRGARQRRSRAPRGAGRGPRALTALRSARPAAGASTRPSVQPSARRELGQPGGGAGRAGGGPGAGPSGRRAPGPPCPPPGRGLTRPGRGAERRRSPPPPRPRGRTWPRRACASSPERPGRAPRRPARRGVPVLALQPSGGCGLAARPAGPQCPCREDGFRASPSMLRARGAWPPHQLRSPSGGLPHHPWPAGPGSQPLSSGCSPFPSPHGCLWPLCDLSQGP